MANETSHKLTATIERASAQFQQTRADYVATCSCGWSHKTRMGYGFLGIHRSAVIGHLQAVGVVR